MSKKRREEEKRILAEMDEAMKETQTEESTSVEEREKQPKKYKFFGVLEDKTPEKIHCRKCKTLMENGVCPTCGHRVYVPMDEEKKKQVRWIVGGVCLALFLILFLWAQFS